MTMVRKTLRFDLDDTLMARAIKTLEKLGAENIHSVMTVDRAMAVRVEEERRAKLNPWAKKPGVFEDGSRVRQGGRKQGRGWKT